MSETRTRVADHIKHNPGVHFNELVRALDLAPGQVQHHVRRLLSDETVRRTEFYGRTHYFPPEFDDWERGALALVRRETARDILGHLLEHGDARPDDVADAIGVARSTLEWHLDHLTERDLVEKERDLHNRVTLVLTHPKRTTKLLDEVSPSLPERFVDRFDRLIDALVEG
ncbi:winged helix-turn-helix transcriptional regulator [Haloferax mediterranei ATCC 33500]|uniref:Transcription regulator n=1 Tax=Haloferax mediterranei (strain ATCC 33500 / DSM 1411 / JCM 8866 / NBRC 14739 / NCIMB 2177 / R-4) TaxID=523841 RepID=I3R0Z6_HALMT|nr:winged helix-turn-helix transcriptional regulator [Haloferax mediterranei]AFK17906.1 transcription regulator [Haloferax mediterranei ATCC 33500]AHZ22670.1 transcriptional regulator [Haloferax mediterranei ATCC 33500]EMA02819.1 transcriptional regulator [Haloferax mediterranei ATCC 33500]MDX5987997.1 winged helix-turn-helix transcriptional regulator [Haloferax mediterranei ATCC 33500]QCQ74463.1 winged helix-turn-helix transcriptional regulator [Haloferax mediterranei ATCC 33500]